MNVVQNRKRIINYLYSKIFFMDLFKWLSIAGALAWLPPVISWIVKFVTKPKLKIIVQKHAELGYTTNGSILNLWVAISAEDVGCLVTNIDLDLRGPNNAQHKLKWDWLEENFFEMAATSAELSTAGPVSIKKNQNAIALKILREGFVEKKIGFQHTKFKDEYGILFELTNEQFTNITQSKQDIATLKASNDYNKFKNLFENSSIWQEGEYTATIKASVLNMNNPFEQKIKFKLSAIDIRTLQKNITTCAEVLERHYFPPPKQELPVRNPSKEPVPDSVETVTDTAVTQIAWNWVNPNIISE